jgi:phosphatidylglycerol---prolipoprotein diacylglyceryl transferase
MDAIAPLGAIGWKVLDRFHVFGDKLALSPHGLGIALGFLTGSYIFLAEARKRGMSEQDASSIPFYALIGTLIGTRLAYVLTHLSQYHSIGDVLAVWRGGLSLLGGIVGAIFACLPLIRRFKIPFLRAMDAASFGIPMGIVIGRVGDLIIGDHLGKPTSWALAFKYHGGNLAGYDCSFGACQAALSGGHTEIITARGAQLITENGAVIGQGVGVHQTALYDFIATMCLVLLLLWLNRVPRRMGIITLTFGLWYGTGRIITDFLRVENRFFGLTGSQWTSIVVVAMCAFMLVRFARHPDRPGEGLAEEDQAGDERERASSAEPRAPAD